MKLWPNAHSHPRSASSPSPKRGSGLSMFGGVYTPSILTILGVIMYLRFGWVLAHVGLLATFLIVTLSSLITFLTALSVCAIATDRVVRAGGAYYMISRSLGIEAGGAVGISLYVAQTLSVALYTIGFAESIAITFPHLNQQVIALLTTLGVAVLAITSAQIAIRAQYLIMAAIVLSLISLVTGPSLPDVVPMGVMGEPVSGSESFWRVFAVFFPAVTGIMAGVSMSGDLKDPSRALPIGTLAAVGTGYAIYMVIPVVLALRVDAEHLATDPLIMTQISVWGPLILLGVWGATLSSAIGSMLGAPRVLQALARDGVLPQSLKILGLGSGPNDEPRLGTLVTLILATIAVGIGDLNLIAPLLTMFFLTTYLLLNISAAIESFLQSPSYRPTFRVHWLLPFLGAIGCISVMFLINAFATVLAAIIVAGIFIWLQERELRTTWGDVRHGIWMALLRTGIFQLNPVTDPKNWRPHILVLSGAPTKRWSLIELADALTHQRGLITVASILPDGSRDLTQQAGMEETIRDYLHRRGVQALVRVASAPDPFDGAERLVETYGLGPLVPNTIVIGDSEEISRRERYCQMLERLHKANRNLVILRENRGRGFGLRQRIDVWWGGLQANGGLMLLLAYLLRSNLDWRRAQITLKLVAADSKAAEAASHNLNTLVRDYRLGFSSQVLVTDGRPFEQILHESSRQADLVFLGMAKPTTQFVQYYEHMQHLTVGLPTTILVLAAPDYAFTAVLSDS